MTKDLIKLLISEYQAYVSQVELIPREVELVDGLNYVFVGLRHAGKSYLDVPTHCTIDRARA